MFDNKYGKVLTVILIIAIVAIIGLLGFIIYDNVIKPNNDKKEMSTAIEEFKKDHDITDDEDDNENDDNNDDNSDTPIINASPIPNPYENSGGSTGGNSSSSSKKTKYNGFTMAGYIEIPKNKVQVPILEKATMNSLNAATGILYPANAKLNEPGNVVIAGHNYRNNLVFSKNKNLKEGDKIYITDETGRKLTYIVYKNFEASPEDTSFFKRDTGGAPEITLTTCTQDSSKRTIIFAKAN